ncbi:hypothetical protein ACLOJK_033947 [Asimina triloba]
MDGDQFIPNNSWMNIDIALSLLRTKNQDGLDDSSPPILTPREEYRRRLEQCLLRDLEGNPFKMLVLDGIPRTSEIRLTDEILQEEKDKANGVRAIRHIPKVKSWFFPSLAIQFSKENIVMYFLPVMT